MQCGLQKSRGRLQWDLEDNDSYTHIPNGFHKELRGRKHKSEGGKEKRKIRSATLVQELTPHGKITNTNKFSYYTIPTICQR
jgi:hypothetical protein